MIAIMFGAGVSAFVYSRFGRRLGYANSQNQLILCAVVFILVSIVFYSIVSMIPG
jgi:hypothetical protein